MKYMVYIINMRTMRTVESLIVVEQNLFDYEMFSEINYMCKFPARCISHLASYNQSLCLVTISCN